MKNNFSGNEIKFKAPLYPFIINNNQLPLVDIGIKLNELQLNKKLRKNSKNKNLKKSNSFSSNSKTKYNNFINDKESLYEINKHLKSELNEVKKELIKIKNENIKKDNEINQRESLINNTFEIKEEEYLKEETKIHNEISDKCLHSNLIYKLKKQYNDLKKELLNKDKDIFLLKKNIKNSRLNELKVENNIILQELNKFQLLYNNKIQENNTLNLKKKTTKEIETNINKQHFITLKNQYKIILKEYKSNNEKKLNMQEQIRNLMLEKKILEEKNYLLSNQLNNLNKNLDIKENILSNNNSNSSKIEVKNAQISEITYILIKNFESKKINKEMMNQIFKNIIDKYYQENEIEKVNLIDNISLKICEIINCKNNEIDKSKINYLIESIIYSSNNELDKFIENFLQLFDNIKDYNENDDKKFTQLIKNKLKKYKSYLNENYKKDFISFFSFRVLLNKQNIFLEDDIVEYLIYRMKKDSILNNKNNSMFDLSLKTLIEIINSENDSNNNQKIENQNEIKENENYIEDDLLQVSNEIN